MNYAHEITLETLALRPPLFLIENCVTSEEASTLPPLLHSRITAYLIESARPELEASRTMEVVTDDFRTSTNTFLYASEHATAKEISHRIAEITRLDVYLQEPLQVIRYEPGQHYHAHYDAFQVGKLLTRKEHPFVN